MGEREKAEREDPARRTTSPLSFARGPALPLLLITGLGLCLRVAGLRWGLPNASHLYSYHPDEIPILGSVLQLDVFSGQLNPHFFNYGTVYTYLVYTAWLIAMGLGLVTLGPHTPAYEQLAQLHLVGRSVTVAFGVATILLVYFLARRITNQPGALLAAFLMAVVPGHVANSHYATVDVTLTFWVTLALLLMTHIEGNDERVRSKFVFWSGLVVGLAAATKYSVALLIFPLLFQCRGKVFGKAALLGCIGACAGFLIGCPYAVLAFPEFQRDFLFEWHHSQTGSGLIFQGTGNGWWYHLSENFPYAIGGNVIYFLIGCYGCYGLRCRDRSKDATRLMLLTWLLTFLTTLGLAKIRFLRYLIPMLPVLVVYLGDAFGAAWTMIQRLDDRESQVPGIWRTAAGIIVSPAQWTLIVAAIIAWSGWTAAAPFIQHDSRDEAAAWLKPQLHTGSTIGLINLPRFYTPPLCPFNGGMMSQRQFEEWNATAPYRIIVTGWDREKLESSMPDYFITSEFETRDEVRLKMREPLEFLRQLSQDYELEKTFKNKQPTVLFAPKFVPHDWLYPNPEIRVYRRRR